MRSKRAWPCYVACKVTCTIRGNFNFSHPLIHHINRSQRHAFHQLVFEYVSFAQPYSHSRCIYPIYWRMSIQILSMYLKVKWGAKKEFPMVVLILGVTAQQHILLHHRFLCWNINTFTICTCMAYTLRLPVIFHFKYTKLYIQCTKKPLQCL